LSYVFLVRQSPSGEHLNKSIDFVSTKTALTYQVVIEPQSFI